MHIVFLREDLFSPPAEGFHLAFLDVLATLERLDP